MSDRSTPSGPSDPPGAIEDRYGTGARTAPRTVRLGRWTVSLYAVVIAALCLLGTLAVAWIAVDNAKDSVEWKDFGFTVLSPEEVEVTFDVTMDPGTTATCTINALNPSFAQVGSREVTVGPTTTRTSRYTVTVATSEEATTGIVDTCDALDTAS